MYREETEQIYNLTSDVTVTSFQMRLTPNLDTTSARCSAEVKGGNFMPPTAAGGWRGGPAAAGLSMNLVDMRFFDIYSVFSNF